MVEINENSFCVVTSYFKDIVKLRVNKLRKIIVVHPKQNDSYKHYHSINWSCIM